MILQQCCWGCSLRFGTFCFICLTQVFHLIPLTAFLLPNIDPVEKPVDPLYFYLDILFVLMVTVICGTAFVGLFFKMSELLAPFIIFCIIYAVSIIISLIATILSGYAILSEEIFLYLMYKLYVLKKLKRDRYDFGGSLVKMIIFCIFFVIWLVLWGYLTVVTYSYYCQLRRQSKLLRSTVSSQGTTVRPTSALPSPKPSTSKSKLVSRISLEPSFVQYNCAMYCQSEDHPQQPTDLETHVVTFK